MENIEKQLLQFKKKLEANMNKMQPQINTVVARLTEATKNMQPQLMKDVEVSGHKAKAVLYADNAIRLEFQDKNFAKEYYKSLQ